MGQRAGSRRGQWPVVAVNAVVAASVLVLVAVLALVVKPPAPPGIAAFAPQAAKPITKAPQAQSAQSGEGAGRCGSGQVCAGPSARPSALPSISPTPRATGGAAPPGLQCYEWPDGSITQTFDPQSPPCISTWDDSKGNGGATSPGVTATEIRVAFPVGSTIPPSYPGLKPVVDFFNSRFQLYGRQIKIVPFLSKQADGQAIGEHVNDATMQHADAASVTQLHVFATTDFLDPLPYSWSLPTFRDTVTKHKIVSLAGGASPPYGSEHDLAAHAPYEWTYHPTIDTLMKNVATMTCRELVGRPAKHAQDPALAHQTRKFALVFPTDALLGGPAPGLGSMLRILDGCGIHSPEVIRYAPNDDNTVLPQTEKFRQLKADGITSLIFFPYTGSKARGAPMTIADRVQYTPEWITIGWNKYLTDIWMNSPQAKAAFGLGIWNKMPQLELQNWHQAYMAGGGDPSQVASLYDGLAFYNEMLLLASGIQMAGPNLTPESFARGLQDTDFPNPGAGAAPFYQGTVGFAAGDAAMVNDYAGFWFDTRVNDTYVEHSKALNDYLATCYVGLGRRWQLDTWPPTDGFYQGGCR